MASGNNLVEITDANFESEVAKSSTPFILDFSAEWCGPCKALAPVFSDLANEYAGRIRFGKIDIDANPQVPTKFQVRSVPTMLLFKDGQVLGQLVGAHPKQRIAELLSKSL